MPGADAPGPSNGAQESNLRPSAWKYLLSEVSVISCLTSPFPGLSLSARARRLKLRQGTRLPAQTLLVALGWLAREERLDFLQKGRPPRLSLRS